jgi:hypothetical protein
MDGFFEVGERVDGLDKDVLQTNEGRALAEACERHADFEVLSLRRIDDGDGQTCDGIEVECDNRRVGQFNDSGIRPVERLLLIWRPRARRYSVRALRTDFPRLLHQNAVSANEPASLCLYAQDWAEVRRTLTPERFLERTLEWLAGAADGSLHADDQALEQLFFTGNAHLILPAGFGADTQRTFDLTFSLREEGNALVFRPVQPEPKKRTWPGFIVRLPAVPHCAIAHVPKTLGEFTTEMGIQWNAGIEHALRVAVDGAYQAGSTVKEHDAAGTMLLFSIPRLRSDATAPEHTDWIGLLLDNTPESLALELGTLFKDPSSGALHVDAHLAGSTGGTDRWKSWPLRGMVMARHALDSDDARRMSGVEEVAARRPRVLAGAGALGSAMLNLWTREGHGRWSVIDDDLVMPHNLVRHTAFDCHIGHTKALAVSHVSQLALPGAADIVVLAGKVGQLTADGEHALKNAALVVDATTSIHASRLLGTMDGIGRCATVFLTPNGDASVLMMESADRAVRLDALEAAYYREMLTAPWGTTHLEANGRMRTGHGCRDASFVLSAETVGLHAANLATQVRRAESDDKALLRVWIRDEAFGTLAVHEVPVGHPHSQASQGWTVRWDEIVEQRMLAIRAGALPLETGGIVLGITDVAARVINIVDVRPAPPDSIATPSSFIRGREGVEPMVSEVRRRTIGEVDYIGEWHSHPPGTTATQSPTDIRQLSQLAERIAQDGLPVVQGIAGEVGGGKLGVTWTVDWRGASAMVATQSKERSNA